MEFNKCKREAQAEFDVVLAKTQQGWADAKDEEEKAHDAEFPNSWWKNVGPVNRMGEEFPSDEEPEPEDEEAKARKSYVEV